MKATFNKKRGVSRLAVGIFLGSWVWGEEVTELAPVAAGMVSEVGRMEDAFAEHGLELAAGEQGRGTLGEALSWQRGISSSFYGSAVSRPVIRGMEGRRVGMSGGGLATGDLSDASPDHQVTIEPLFLREVKVIRGSAAIVYGGGTIGGVVDGIMDYQSGKLDAEGRDGRWGMLYDSGNNGLTNYLRAGERAASWGIRLNGLYRDFGDYRIPGNARTAAYDASNRIRLPSSVRGQVAENPHGTVPNTGGRAMVVGIGGGWYGDRQSHSGSYQRYESRYGVPLDGHVHGNPYGQPGVTGPSLLDGIAVDLRQDRLTIENRIDPHAGPVKSIELRSGLTRHNQQELEGAFLSNDYRKESGEMQLRADWEGGQVRLVTGGHVAAGTLDNRNISYGAGRADEDRLQMRNRNLALWAWAEWPAWREWRVRAGGRVEWQDARRRDREGLRRQEAAQHATVEIERAFGSGWTAALQLSHAQRMPTVDELFLEAPHGAIGVFQIPDPTLAVERADGLELRIGYAGDQIQLRVSGFARRFKDYIYLRNAGYEVDGLTAYQFAQEQARFVGAELQLDHRIGQLGPAYWQLGTFADWMRGDSLDRDQPLPRIPAARLGLRVKATAATWQFELRGMRVLAQNRVPLAVFGTLSYESPSRAYTMIAVELTKAFSIAGVRGSVRIGVENLLDEEARQHTSFLKDVAPLPGRRLQAAVSLLF